MTSPLRTDIGGEIHRFYAQPAPRSSSAAPVGRWRVSAASVMLFLFALAAPMMVGVADRPLVAAGIVSVLLAAAFGIEWQRRREGDPYVVHGTLTRGRVVHVDSKELGYGNKRRTVHTLDVLYRRPSGQFAAGRVTGDELGVFVSGAEGAVCYVVHEPESGNAAVALPGGALGHLEAIEPNTLDIDYEAETFAGDLELERPISTMMGQVPPWSRMTVLLTILVGIFFAMTALSGAWMAAGISFGVWAACMTPVLLLRARQRNRPQFGDEAMILHGRYIPYSQVISAQPGGVRLSSGEESFFWGDPEQSDNYYEELSHRLKAFRASASPQVPAALKAANRTPRDWTRDVRQLLASGGASQFRVAGLTREAIWDIASNVRGAISERAAAAVALSSGSLALEALRE